MSKVDSSIQGINLTEKPILYVDLDELERDPYPIFEQVRALGGVAWIEPLKMWYVTGYNDIRTILLDDVQFSTGTDHSLLFDTFGAHMLTQNGADHVRARSNFRGAFAPTAIRKAMSEHVSTIVNTLIEGFACTETFDLRHAFAARVPVLTMLALFGLPPEREPELRLWYDHFERALANFTWDSKVRETATKSVAAFHAMFAARIAAVRKAPGDDLLSRVALDDGPESLSTEEIISNASIIFFGGISTVEALLLNSLYASALHGIDLKGAEPKFIDAVIDETMRWMSPVQSATRHTVAPITIAGVAIAPTETVNCMLGAANRDPAIFDNPNLFQPGRRNASHHLGFATGAHFCLGSHLARLEVGIAIRQLFEQLPGFCIDVSEDHNFHGYEFRQPKTLIARWRKFE
jgi:cytochrome P450